MHKFYLLIIGLLFSIQAWAQVLNVRVEVAAPQVQNVNSRTLEVLKKAVSDFLNNRAWGESAIRPEERIDCSFNIVISSFDGVNKFQASAQVNSARPVYGTNYNSPILSFKDKYFNFNYTEGDQLEFNENQDMGTLSSLLAFYAHVIVGMDMDTFKSLGGTSMLNKARNIVNYSQSNQTEGWRAMDATDNRYWLINNLLDRRYAPYREFYYTYHMDGLDHMVENESTAKKKMAELLLKLKEVDRSNTGNVLTTSLFTAKSNEFVGLFSKMPGNESMKIFNLLVDLDPSNTTKYDKLKN